MKLNKKIFLLLVISIILPLIIGIGITFFSIKSSVQKIELDKATQNLVDVKKYMSSLCVAHGEGYLGWTMWTELFNATTTKDINWLKENVLTMLNPNTPSEAIGIFDKDGNLLISENIPAELKVNNVKTLESFKNLGNNKYLSGMNMTSDGLYLYTIVKVVKNDDEDFKNPGGYVLYSRKVTDKTISQGRDIINVDIAIKLNNGIENSTNKQLLTAFNNLKDLKGTDALTTVRTQGNKMFTSAAQILYDTNNNSIGYLIIENASESGVSALNTLLLFSCILVILVIALSGVTLLWIRFKVINPIKQAAIMEQKIAQGDLLSRESVQSNDEIGELIKQMNFTADKLETMIKNIKSTAQTVVVSSENISNESINLSSRTQQQASSLAETSSAIEELMSTVKQNADNAQKTNMMSQKTKVIVSEGNQVVKQTISAMDAVSQSSKKISEITNVVNEIAFQTNLLALNAAVEAARAGEQGRGFAVVAVEVRNLARRSADAAKEIQTLINDSVDKISNSHSLVISTGDNLNEITESVERMSELIAEISAASREQSIGIEEVNKSVYNMDKTTQQNASLVELASSSSKEMKNKASELFDLVSEFKIEN